jgi:hypothetical protein
MGFAFHTYLITPDDRLARLASTKFGQMLRDPDAHRLPQFAGQRVRIVSVVVEFANRAPVRIVRRTFAVLAFDRDGRLDLERFGQQQAALAEAALAPVLGGARRNGALVDAATQFVAQGGQWRPTAQLARAIDEAAMGRSPCPRV